MLVDLWKKLKWVWNGTHFGTILYFNISTTRWQKALRAVFEQASYKLKPSRDKYMMVNKQRQINKYILV